MQIKKWIFDGHPQRYHVAALALAVLALSTAFVTTILAQETGSSTGTSTTTGTEPVSCSYSYSDWNVCQPDGKHYRTVTDMSPNGCVQTSAPKTVESCNYSAPQCEYSYSPWGVCQSSGKQGRSLLSTSPSGCVKYTAPVLEQSCSYVSTTTDTTTNTVTSTTACSYSYSDWNVCQPDGKHYRTVTGMSPIGCVQTSVAKTVESCTYVETTTPTADQCVYAYSQWGVCQSNGKRTRLLSSKLPTGCQEYVRPVLEQSCIYDTTTTATDSTTGTNTTTLKTVTTTTGTTTTSTSGETPSNVTPTFSFMNVNEGMTIRGIFEIKGQVQGAQGVEYYLVPTGSNTYKYIGSGSKVSDTGWNLKFRSEGFPNGEFYLRAKIKNMYGEYGGGQRKISVANDGGIATGTTVSGEVFTPLAMNVEKKTEMLQAIGEELKIPMDEAGGFVPKTPDQQKMYIFSYCESHPEKCFPERDSDNDGLSDIDEIRYGTDHKGADSDFDGFIDGDEVKNGFDPVKYSPGDQGDRIVFESPKVAGETKEKIYAIKNVELKETSLTEAGDSEKKLRLTGKGLPNSFVTIYIYSDPIVLTVKTDSDGNWTYELDKELENGEHEAYVAITDNTGKITGKSQPFAFVKTAQAVTVIPAAAAARTEETLPVTQNRAQRDIFFLVSIVIAALAVALAVIGLVKHKHNALKEGSL